MVAGESTGRRQEDALAVSATVEKLRRTLDPNNYSDSVSGLLLKHCVKPISGNQSSTSEFPLSGHRGLHDWMQTSVQTRNAIIPGLFWGKAAREAHKD